MRRDGNAKQNRQAVSEYRNKERNDIVNNYCDKDDNGKPVERTVPTHLIIQKAVAN